MAPPPGWVTVSADDPPLSVTARLAEDRPNIDSGYGGWDEVERPRRSPLTTYKSAPPLHLTLPMLIDEWVEGTSVEDQIDQLERMGQPTSSADEPPQVRVSAIGGAVPHTDRTWVVADIAWGDALMNDDGDRVRQQVTMSLIEYVADVYLTELSAANRQRAKAAAPKKKPGAPAKRVVAKKAARPRWAKAKARSVVADDDWGSGEDLLAIAARQLGDASRWPEIAALNGMRDPRSVRPGQVIRLP